GGERRQTLGRTSDPADVEIGEQARMRARRWAAVSAALLSAAVMGGCSSGGGAPAGEVEPAPSGAEAQPVSPAVAPEGDAPDDADLCTAFGDVLTIVENADV